MKPNVEDLIPPAREIYEQFEYEMGEADVLWKPTCIKRTREEQLALYAQGRESLSVINELRRVAGLYQLSEAEGRRVVTWTKNSRHLPLSEASEYGKLFPEFIGLCLAWDIVILHGEGGKVSWDLKVDVDKDSIPDYEEAANIGESLGLIVGARWKKPDYPHYEFDIRRYANEKE